MLTDALTGVAVETTTLRSGIDRYLELLTSTERLKQINDGCPALSANVGRCLLGHMKFHNGFNHLTTQSIPQPARLTWCCV